MVRLRTFDEESFGQEIASGTGDVVGIYRVWLEAHLDSGISDFAHWVSRTTGRDLTEILNDDDRERLKPLLAETDEMAEAILESLDAGP